MDSSWFTQEPLAQKSDWLADSSLYFSRYSNKELKIGLLNIFPQTGSKESGIICWLFVCHLFYE